MKKKKTLSTRTSSPNGSLDSMAVGSQALCSFLFLFLAHFDRNRHSPSVDKCHLPSCAITTHMYFMCVCIQHWQGICSRVTCTVHLVSKIAVSIFLLFIHLFIYLIYPCIYIWHMAAIVCSADNSKHKQFIDIISGSIETYKTSDIQMCTWTHRTDYYYYYPRCNNYSYRFIILVSISKSKSKLPFLLLMSFWAKPIAFCCNLEFHFFFLFAIWFFLLEMWFLPLATQWHTHIHANQQTPLLAAF